MARTAEHVGLEPDMQSQPAMILVVDDHPMFRLGVSQFLQPQTSFEVVEAMSQQAANVVLRNHAIDLAIVDISLPDGSGLELIKHQKNQHKQTRWLVLSVHTDTFYQTRARQAGANGFLSKSVIQDDLLKAVNALLSGKDYPVGWERAPGRLSQTEQQPLEALSQRELTVFRLIAEGNTVEKIANGLSRSRKTINAIRDRIRAKLGIGSSAELTRFATQWYLSQAHSSVPKMKFKPTKNSEDAMPKRDDGPDGTEDSPC